MPRWRFRVLPAAVLPDGFWSPDADFEKFQSFQIWVWNRGRGNLKKKVSMPFWSEYEGELPCDDGSYKLVKRLRFSTFLVTTHRFTWKSLCFWIFRAIRDPGWPYQFRAAKKKHWNTLSFWSILAAEFVASKAEFVTGCFVCTGSEFFPKHSVSRRREASFQLQEIRGGLPGGQGRSGHTSLEPKRCT